MTLSKYHKREVMLLDYFLITFWLPDPYKLTEWDYDVRKWPSIQWPDIVCSNRMLCLQCWGIFYILLHSMLSRTVCLYTDEFFFFTFKNVNAIYKILSEINVYNKIYQIACSSKSCKPCCTVYVNIHTQRKNCLFWSPARFLNTCCLWNPV